MEVGGCIISLLWTVNKQLKLEFIKSLFMFIYLKLDLIILNKPFSKNYVKKVEFKYDNIFMNKFVTCEYET